MISSRIPRPLLIVAALIVLFPSLYVIFDNLRTPPELAGAPTSHLSGVWSRAVHKPTRPPSENERFKLADLQRIDTTRASDGTVQLTLASGATFDAKVREREIGYLLLNVGEEPAAKTLVLVQQGDQRPIDVYDPTDGMTVYTFKQGE